MKSIESLSDKRMLMEVKVNGKKAVLFLDSGASVGLFDYKQRKIYGLKEGRPYGNSLIGGGGDIRVRCHCDTPIELPNGRLCGQFLLADISNIVDSVHRQTGETIIGIMSLRQMKEQNMQMDFNDNLIIFE